MKMKDYARSFSIALLSAILVINVSHNILISYASGNTVPSGNVVVTEEYLIPDEAGISSRYVLLASNETDSNIAISAEFYAVDSDGDVLATVTDYIDAVRKDQEFILYGQFKNEIVENAANFKYTLSFDYTDECAYDAIDIKTDTDEGSTVIDVTGTNYAQKDVEGISVRAIFYSDNKPVAFDYVNIADSGYLLHSGSTNYQQIGTVNIPFDDYVVTYTSCGF